MHEKRDMPAVPVKLGCVSRDESITLWVSVPVVYREAPERKTVFRRAEKRRRALEAAVEYVYRFITCGCCAGMLYLLWRMAV